MFSSKRVRNQVVPAGIGDPGKTGAQPAVGALGRYQPFNSPNEPPTFITPRALSRSCSLIPSIFQVIGTEKRAAEGVDREAEIRPRPSLWASSAIRSQLWPSLRTITAIVCV